MTDYTSSLYSLVVFSSATLGVCQYVNSTYVAVFDSEKKRITTELEKIVRSQPARTTTTRAFEHDQDIREKNEYLQAQQPKNFAVWFGLIALLLPYTAIAQIVTITNKLIGKEIPYSHECLGVTLIIAFIVYLVSVILILAAIRKNSSNAETMKDEADTLIATARTGCANFIRGYHEANGTDVTAAQTAQAGIL